jgi:hypothetical protein
MRAAHVPMKVFGFKVQREHIGKNAIHAGGDILRSFRTEITGRYERRASPSLKIALLCGFFFSHVRIPVC